MNEMFVSCYIAKKFLKLPIKYLMSQGNPHTYPSQRGSHLGKK